MLVFKFISSLDGVVSEEDVCSPLDLSVGVQHIDETALDVLAELGGVLGVGVGLAVQLHAVDMYGGGDFVGEDGIHNYEYSNRSGRQNALLL